MTIGKMTTACWVVFGIMCLGFLPLILAVYAIPGLPPALKLLGAILVVLVVWWGPFGYGMYLAQAGIGNGDRRLLRRGIRGTALVLKADVTGMMIGGQPDMGIMGRTAYRYQLRVSLPDRAPYETYCMICARDIHEGETVRVAASPHNRKRVTIDVGQDNKGKGKGAAGRVPQPGHRPHIVQDTVPKSSHQIEDSVPRSNQTRYQNRTPDSAQSENSTRLRQLAELGKLHREGVLTDDEFAAEKARILGH